MDIIYGLNPVIEAIAAGKRQIFEIMVSREDIDEIRIKAEGIPVNSFSRREIDNLAKTKNHQGIVAKVSGYRYSPLDDLLSLETVVLLDSVEDPQNLGAVIRSTYGLAGAGIILPENRSASITAAVVKASAGASEHASIARVKNLRMAAKELKKAGFWLVGLDASGSQELADVPEFEKLALVMGGEDTGIRPVMHKETDVMARIPMKKTFNSLNVAQSASIALYELVARRK